MRWVCADAGTEQPIVLSETSGAPTSWRATGVRGNAEVGDEDSCLRAAVPLLERNYWSETHRAVTSTLRTASGSKTFQPNHMRRS